MIPIEDLTDVTLATDEEDAKRCKKRLEIKLKTIEKKVENKVEKKFNALGTEKLKKKMKR